MVIKIDGKVDLVHDEDNDCYYLQEYAYDGRGTTRESIEYRTLPDAVAVYRTGTVEWGDWH